MTIASVRAKPYPLISNEHMRFVKVQFITGIQYVEVDFRVIFLSSLHCSLQIG